MACGVEIENEINFVLCVLPTSEKMCFAKH